jgi:general secretion pathway protein L
MPTWLGIDIGSASVKVAVVRSTYRKLALTGLVVSDIIGESDTQSALRDAVGRALAAEPHGADAVATALDGSRVAIHRIALPETAEKQMADVLSFELEAQIPFDMAEAVFDWRVLGGNKQEGQLQILAAVARSDDVRASIDLIKETTRLEAERVGVGALTLGALVPYIASLSNDVVAVVDLGSKKSDVLVVERGEAVYARTLSTGTEGLPGTAARLARDIRLSLAAHRAQGGASPARVYLCGGGAFVSGAEGFLSGELEIEVAILPEPAIDASALDGEAVRDLPRFAKAVALALSLAGRGTGINLRRGALAFERGFAWVRERIPLLGGWAAVILVSFIFSAWARFYGVHRERDVLQTALASVTKDVLGHEASTAQEAQDLLAKEVGTSDEDPMPHADGFDVMVRLSQAIPMSMTHDIEELDIQRSHVTVRGIVGSIPDAQSIASTLSEDRCFADVKIKSTTQAVGSDRQKYVMEFDLKCPEDIKSSSKKKGEGSSAGTGGK